MRFLLSFLLFTALAPAVPCDFNLPSQPASEALLAFSLQARIEVLFPFDELSKVKSTPVTGRYEPEEAIKRLLDGTGFSAHRNNQGKFTVNLPASVKSVQAPPADKTTSGRNSF